MYFDPLYIFVMAMGLVLGLGAQAWVKAAGAAILQPPYFAMHAGLLGGRKV